MLTKRINKINKSLDAILGYQKYEIRQENRYKWYQERLAESIFRMTCIEMFLVMASAGYSVYSLRKFFVKKHIM